MVITKLIGRTTNFKGKTLWEIVGNLKNFGVGRMVIRSVFQRYPEPCYMKIIKVEPQPNEEPYRKVKVWVEKTFRGRTYPKMTEILSTSYKADYQLVPKDQESLYLNNTAKAPNRLIPSKLEFPPLLKQYIMKDYAKKGIEIPEDMHLKVSFSYTPNRSYNPASPDCPDVLSIGLGTQVPKVLSAEQNSG